MFNFKYSKYKTRKSWEQLGNWILSYKKIVLLIYAWENYGKFFFNEEVQNESTYKYENITFF